MNDIEIEIDNLFSEVKKLECYKNYVKAKKKIGENIEITNLIEKIKINQKKYINTKDKNLKKEIDELYKKLNSYPLYVSYLEFKEELNEELNLIKSVFENYFGDILKLEL